jgi:hypothetical protein
MYERDFIEFLFTMSKPNSRFSSDVIVMSDNTHVEIHWNWVALSKIYFKKDSDFIGEFRQYSISTNTFTNHVFTSPRGRRHEIMWDGKKKYKSNNIDKLKKKYPSGPWIDESILKTINIFLDVLKNNF